MQDSDSFFSPIPGFEGDVPIPAIPISACDPGAEPFEEPPLDPVPMPHGVGPASERRLSTRISLKGQENNRETFGWDQDHWP
jgi:hypothetical protein